MDQKCDRLNPSATFEVINLHQRLEKKSNDVKSFNNSIKNIKRMITHFSEKNYKSKKNTKRHKMITMILKSIDTFVIIATTSSSITLFLTGVFLIVISDIN